MQTLLRKRAALLSAVGIAMALPSPAAHASTAHRRIPKDASGQEKVTVNATGATRCLVSQDGDKRVSFVIRDYRTVTITLRFATPGRRNHSRHGVKVACELRDAKYLIAPGALLSARISAFTRAASDVSKAKLPTQGIFDYCPVETLLSECETRLQTIAAAGLSIDVQPLPADSPSLASYLQAMKTAGIKAMWEVSNPSWWGYNGNAPWGYDSTATDLAQSWPYSTWAAACGCEANGQLLAFIASTLAQSATTYGWYVADDSQFGPQPPAQTLEGITQFARDLQGLAPGTTTLISTWGTSQLANAYGAAQLTAAEAYPVGDAPQSVANIRFEAAQVANTANYAQGLADNRHGLVALVLQAFNWAACESDMQASGASAGSRYPSATELLAMRNAALSNSHPALLLWYDLEQTIGWPTGQQPSDCRAPADPAAQLAGLSAAVKAPYPTSTP